MEIKNELASKRRSMLVRAMKNAYGSELSKVYTEYFLLLLDLKLTLLLQSSGEEAIALRGEIRCLKHMLGIVDKGDTPFTDSI